MKKLLDQLPKSKSKYGYSEIELKTFMKPNLLKKFKKWMNGQTMMLTKNGTTIFYHSDVWRFLYRIEKGLPTYFD